MSAPAERAAEREAGQAKPPSMECESCREAIEGVAYFHRGYADYDHCGRGNRPHCADCTHWRCDPDRLPTQLCEACGREFAWLYRGHRDRRVSVCSPECRQERDTAKRRVRHKPLFCEVCGEVFTPKRSGARTCSDRCRQRLHRSPSRINGALDPLTQIAVTEQSESRMVGGAA